MVFDRMSDPADAGQPAERREARRGCDENGPAVRQLPDHVSIQICSFLVPVRLAPPRRRPILIATPLYQSRTWCTRSCSQKTAVRGDTVGERKGLARKLVLGIINSSRIPGDVTSWMESPAVIPSTVVIATVATPIMISAAPSTPAIRAAGARKTAGVSIPTAPGEGSRSRATPTTAAPSAGVDGHKKGRRADGNRGSEYFTQHSNLKG